MIAVTIIDLYYLEIFYITRVIVFFKNQYILTDPC